jgi:hypothetical protein
MHSTLRSRSLPVSIPSSCRTFEGRTAGMFPPPLISRCASRIRSRASTTIKTYIAFDTQDSAGRRHIEQGFGISVIRNFEEHVGIVCNRDDVPGQTVGSFRWVASGSRRMIMIDHEGRESLTCLRITHTHYGEQHRCQHVHIYTQICSLYRTRASVTVAIGYLGVQFVTFTSYSKTGFSSRVDQEPFPTRTLLSQHTEFARSR